MTLFSRLGRSFAPALLCLALTGSALAAPGSPFTLSAGTPKTLTPMALVAALKTQTTAQASGDGKTLTFARKAVRLVAETGPDDDMMSYRIESERNPMLVVPGAYAYFCTVR